MSVQVINNGVILDNMIMIFKLIINMYFIIPHNTFGVSLWSNLLTKSQYKQLMIIDY